MSNDSITELFDKQGNLVGALLTAEAWLKVKPLLQSDKDKADEAQPHTPEPMDDWETLTSFWDFPYPVDTDVACSHCGSATDDWSNDEPRLFRLRAASLSGLVTFTCTTCHSKIIKKHFKDEIVVETYPATDKNPRKEGLY